MSELGIQLTVDDMGADCSSMQRLQQLLISTIKIDGALVERIEEADSPNRAILETIIRASHSFGICAVAKGVETAAQVAVLQSLGADVGQGYFFAPPARRRGGPHPGHDGPSSDVRPPGTVEGGWGQRRQEQPDPPATSAAASDEHGHDDRRARRGAAHERSGERSGERGGEQPRLRERRVRDQRHHPRLPAQPPARAIAQGAPPRHADASARLRGSQPTRGPSTRHKRRRLPYRRLPYRRLPYRRLPYRRLPYRRLPHRPHTRRSSRPTANGYASVHGFQVEAELPSTAQLEAVRD